MGYKSIKMMINIICIIILLQSCNNDLVIYDINNEMFNISKISEDNIIIIGQGFCKDCLIHLVEFCHNNKETFIVVYPNYKYNNLVKITITEFLVNNNVDRNLIYWIDNDTYNEHYNNLQLPFVIKKNGLEIIKYEKLFDSNGFVKIKSI